ncbi:zinc finger, RING/FYVE/PHD-type [Artemisia annua]|uniref:RING-type E3 ubiquitin transferase n=1 Tax=Artemisia annua TaxID=35608 RepID=A0A2U1KWS2_ARTAN|nr:zinc finger, RING/FYVE/PHD-type [Artemisia annua]
MDQINFSLKEITKYHHKWIVVALVLVLVAAKGSRAAEIPNEPPTVSPPNKTGPKLNQHILIGLGCVLIPLLLICSIFFFYIRRCAEKQLALAANTGYHSQRSSMKITVARGLDPTVIAAFKSFMYSAVKEIKLGQHVLECAVCLNEFKGHEALRLLPECSHVFHRECIDKWLGLHVTCPVCRASLVPKPNNESESCCGPNGPLNSHVSVKVTDLKHDMLPRGKFSRSYSMGHLVVRQPVVNVERYTLMLRKEAQYFMDSSSANPSTSLDVMFPMENGLKHCLKSSSANFVRGSDYFDYESLKTIV